MNVLLVIVAFARNISTSAEARGEMPVVSETWQRKRSRLALEREHVCRAIIHLNGLSQGMTL